MSTTFDVAHFRTQGQDVIAVCVTSQFGMKSNLEQNRILNALQFRANAAGLKGTVVPVWDAGGGRMGFLAPSQWRSFFGSIGLADIAANINRQLRCA